MTLATQANDPNTPRDARPRLVFAPAKVNLTLKILGRRPDEYHELESLVLFAADAADELTLTPANTTTLEISGPNAKHLDTNEPNLIATACDALSAANRTLRFAHIELKKYLPVAAGIGGGSADAAAVLRALKELNREKRDTIDWLAIARHIGADVPVCLESRATIMRGTGEKLQPLPDFPTLNAVLVNPDIPPPANKTAQVFKTLNAPDLENTHGKQHYPSALQPLLTTCDPTVALRAITRLDNDLEHAATTLMPAIKTVKSEIEASPGCVLTRLSGAGPTCFGLYHSTDAAQNACKLIRAKHPTWWVHATRLI